MIKKNTQKIIIFLLLVIFIISLIALLYFLSPEEIVNKIGIHNAYLFALVISFLAGFSAWTSFSMVAVLIALTLGGINPLYLGLISGAGLATGDLIMFYASSKGRELIKGKWEKRLDKFSKFFEGNFKKIIPIISYIYIGLTPFPNDFLIIFLALIKYPIKKLYLPIILGDLTYPLLITLLATKGIMLFT